MGLLSSALTIIEIAEIISLQLCAISLLFLLFVMMESKIAAQSHYFTKSVPDRGKEVSSGGEAESLRPGIVGRGEVPLKLLLLHDPLHL